MSIAVPRHHIDRSDNGIKFSVYRKLTNKDDYIHYLSNHDLRTKSGVVIGFFLRAYRICSGEYLSAECAHVMEVFDRLGYPIGLLGWLKKKAMISRRNSVEKKEGKKEWIVVPYSMKAETVTRFFMKIGVDIVHSSGKKIRDIVVDSPKVQPNENSAVYASADLQW